MHRHPTRGAIPGVEAGVLLAFPCPACHRWARPAFDTRTFTYECVLCNTSIDPALLEDCYQDTRHMMRLMFTHS